MLQVNPAAAQCRRFLRSLKGEDAELLASLQRGAT
jgi:hypothetical protein